MQASLMRVATLIVASCHSASAPTPLPPHAAASSGDIVSSAPPANVALMPDDERDAILLAHSRTAEVVTSDRFLSELCKLDDSHVGVRDPAMKGCEIARYYYGLVSQTPRLPIMYQHGGLSFLETAHTTTSMRVEVKRGAPIQAHATIVLRSPVISRVEGSVEAFACTVNTLAHEWTHAVSATGAESFFTDEDHKDSTVALVSYTVGSLAQCVFLDAHGYSGMDLQACVREIGRMSFDQSTCSAKGARALQARSMARSR